MNMDNTKLFAKNEKELETLIQTVRIYSQDIGMEFGIVKCTMLVMISGKRRTTEEIELPDQEKIRTPREKETYKYLGILETGTIKQVKIREQIKKRESQENQKTTSDKTIEQEPCKSDTYLGSPPCKILRTILEVDQWRTSTNRPKNKKTNEHVYIFTNPSARAGYDTRLIFKRSLTGLNSEFSFS